MELFGSWSSEPSCYCEQDLSFCRCAGNSPKHLVSGCWSEEFMAILSGSQAMITNQ